MIPRFKTWLYVLFVFPVLSVSVEGRRCERKNLGSIAEHGEHCETHKCVINAGWHCSVRNLMHTQEDILFLLSENKPFVFSLLSVTNWTC